MITKTKKQLLSEMIGNAGIDPKKVLGEDDIAEGEPRGVYMAAKDEVKDIKSFLDMFVGYVKKLDSKIDKTTITRAGMALDSIEKAGFRKLRGMLDDYKGGLSLRVRSAHKGESLGEKSDIEEAAAYKYPRTRKELAPKTKANLKKRAVAFKKAVDFIDSALKELAKIPPVDFMGDIPHFQEKMQFLVDGEYGEGGMRSLVKGYEQDVKKGV